MLCYVDGSFVRRNGSYLFTTFVLGQFLLPLGLTAIECGLLDAGLDRVMRLVNRFHDGIVNF
jgi:hypothetical protein